jgi:predicted protein tyrosine phosphatase
MQLIVYSRSMIESLVPHEVPHVIISITSSPEDVARLQTNAMCLGVLRMSFPDADAPSDRFTQEALFSRAQAAEVWRFVLHYRSAVDRILVHCDAGMSRSPAVAAAIAKILTGDDAEFFRGRFIPNKRVYRFLLDTYADSVEETLAPVTRHTGGNVVK